MDIYRAIGIGQLLIYQNFSSSNEYRHREIVHIGCLDSEISIAMIIINELSKTMIITGINSVNNK